MTLGSHSYWEQEVRGQKRHLKFYLLSPPGGRRFSHISFLGLFSLNQENKLPLALKSSIDTLGIL